MDYVTKLKEAQDTGGPKAVCGTVLLVMPTLSRTENGRYEHKRFVDIFTRDGNEALIPSFDFCNVLMGNSIYYAMRDRSDTPLKQIKFLLELIKIHADYKRKTPDEYAFMLDAVVYAMEENVKEFILAQEQQEAKHGLGGHLAQYMVKLSSKLIEYEMDGPYIDKLKKRALVAKLTK